MKVNRYALFILVLFQISFATSLGFDVSNYGSPSVGLNLNIWKISSYLDFVYSTNMAEFVGYNYDYTELLKKEAKETHLGLRVNPNYSIKSDLFIIQIGPLLGMDRFWFNSFGTLPSALGTIVGYDSTIIYNQYRIGVYLGAKVFVIRKFAVIFGSSFGYLSGENVNRTYLVKARMYKFDILDNKIGLSLEF